MSLIQRLMLLERFAAPTLITLLYWLLLLAVIAMAYFHASHFHGNLWMGLWILFSGSIGVRVLCELLIIPFRIEQHLRPAESPPQAETEVEARSQSEQD
ncbi:hypothetical protein [Ferrimonas marina]|uniref:DUF4282 domain-containing protein n=1 Tax=Ferrimonas marina TaxID=299255 RepID=A0A1M5X5Y9_9GAMM|nr:hypothetical protein [Ferrimonas marina]SHH94623.1 hypothetical protein SAMN02745129_3214 [Ferrimonas marina]